MSSKPKKAYRRKKTPDAADIEAEEESGEIAQSPVSGQRLDPGQMAQLIVDMRNGTVDREAARNLAQPMTELAKAFAVQAEVLKAVHEGQRTLREAIDNDKKTDVVVNSTNALNDTFRGMRGVQQKLLEELGENKRRDWRSKLLYAGAGLVAFLVTAYLFRSFMTEQSQTKQINDEKVAGLATDWSEKFAALESNLVGMKDELGPQFQPLLDEALDETRRLREANSMHTEELQRLRVEVEALREQKDELARLRESDASSGRKLATLEAKNDQLEEQLTFYMSKYEEATARVEKLQEDVIASIRGAGSSDWVDDLEEPKGAARSLSAVGPDGSVNPQDALEDARGAEKAADESGGRDPRVEAIATQQLEQIRTRLNGLMTAHRGNHTFRIDALAGVKSTHLEGVTVVEVAPGRGIVKEINAEKLTFVVSALGDQVELEFEQGDTRVKKSPTGLGPATPFYKGRYRQTIICTNGARWLSLSEGYVLVD